MLTPMSTTHQCEHGYVREAECELIFAHVEVADRHDRERSLEDIHSQTCQQGGSSSRVAKGVLLKYCAIKHDLGGFLQDGNKAFSSIF